MSLDNNLCDKSDPLMDISIYPNDTNTRFVGELLAKKNECPLWGFSGFVDYSSSFLITVHSILKGISPYIFCASFDTLIRCIRTVQFLTYPECTQPPLSCIYISCVSTHCYHTTSFLRSPSPCIERKGDGTASI